MGETPRRRHRKEAQPENGSRRILGVTFQAFAKRKLKTTPIFFQLAWTRPFRGGAVRQQEAGEHLLLYADVSFYPPGQLRIPGKKK